METILTFFADFWDVLAEMAPYLLFGFAVAGLLSVFISAEWVQKHLGRGRFGPILKAAAMGVPMPLCSCGVIPVSASLRRQGAGSPAAVSFLISTPQTGVDSIMVTYSLLGPVFAIYRPLAALISGVVGGLIASLLGGPAGARAASGGAQQDTTHSQHSCCNGSHASEQAESASPEELAESTAGEGKKLCCGSSSEDEHAVNCPRGGLLARLGRAARYGFLTLPADIAGALLVGLAVAAGISALVEPGALANWVEPGWSQILLLMAAGIPIYVCATASIPVAGALILMGASPGAAFAFLMTGSATNAATVSTVWKTMGRSVAMVYVGTMMATAFAGGLLLDVFLDATAVQKAMHGDMVPAWVNSAGAVVLLAVLGWGLWTNYGRRLTARRTEPQAADSCPSESSTCRGGEES